MILGTGVNVRCTGLWLALLLLLCLCVSSWANCITKYPTTGWAYNVGVNTFDKCGTDNSSCVNLNCPSTVYVDGGYYVGFTQKSKSCNVLSQANTTCVNNGCSKASQCVLSQGQCSTKIFCSTQAEADSVACELNPSLPQCAVVSDTLIFACSESIVNGQAVATIYRLSCKATNGELSECNGKQNVDIATDGQPVKQMQGTCSQNGLPNGPFGGASPQDSTELPNGANADCFAITGSKCHMKDKISGNTFTCDCDGSCQVAIQNLMAGSASCTNPYPQPTSSSDSLIIGGSSDSTVPGSSDSGSSSPSSSDSGGGETGSSGSGGEGGEGTSSMYDPWSPLLQNIQANTQYTGQAVDNVAWKIDRSNSLLQDIANKDWNPTINVGGPTVNVAGDTNIINVQGDTARAGAEILRWLTDENYSIDTSGRVKWNNFTDSIQGLVRGQLDSLEGDSITDMGDSLGTAVQGIHTAWGALRDSIGNSAIEDSIGRWQGMFLDNGTLTGSGSDNCPQVLLRQYSLSFPILGSTITVPFGNLGVYICSPVAGTGVNLWVLARTLLRAMVAIACMYWLYKAVLGIDEKDGE